VHSVARPRDVTSEAAGGGKTPFSGIRVWVCHEKALMRYLSRSKTNLTGLFGFVIAFLER